jgi:hypothetical protein
MANYRERDRKNKAAAAKENTIFFQRQIVQQEVYLPTKISFLATVKTNATYYGLESHYPPTHIYLRVT